MSQDDTSYYRQRAVTQRAMALASERQNVREIHEELARQYEALATTAGLHSTFAEAMRQAKAGATANWSAAREASASGELPELASRVS